MNVSFKYFFVGLFFKSILFTLVFFFFLTSCSQQLSSETNTSHFVPLASKPLEKKIDLSQYESDRFILTLPIDEMSNPQIHFIFESPEGFHTPITYLEAFLSGRSTILEYIPEGETLDNWSEIITVNLLKGRGIQAKLFTDALVKGLSSQVKDYRVFQLNVVKEGVVETSEVAMMYRLFDDSVEVLYMGYFSGAYDCSGVQYSIKFPYWLGEIEFQQVAKKMRAYASEMAYPVRNKDSVLTQGSDQ